MGKCRHGKDAVKKSKAKYECKKCGALTDDKKDICKCVKLEKKKK